MEREKILVIKLGALGDIMMYIGIIRGVVERHPDAEITFMTHASIVPLMRQTGWFSDFIVDNRGRYTFGELKRICLDTLARRRFDLIYDLQSSHRTLNVYYRLVRLLTRNALKWGRTDLQNDIDFLETPAKRMLSWGRQTVRHVALKKYPADVSFCHGEHRHFGLLPERYMLLIPGCSPTNPEKRWPVERFRAVSEYFGRKGLRSVVMGTGAEAAEIAAIARDNPFAVDFMNKSSLIDIPDLARGAEIVLGNDTGPSHMARLSGAKAVILFNERTHDAAVEMPRVVNIVAQSVTDVATETVVSALEELLAR